MVRGSYSALGKSSSVIVTGRHEITFEPRLKSSRFVIGLTGAGKTVRGVECLCASVLGPQIPTRGQARTNPQEPSSGHMHIPALTHLFTFFFFFKVKSLCSVVHTFIPTT